jgi:uncharacterized protein YprB with RNaseH-like and TPR domain
MAGKKGSGQVSCCCFDLETTNLCADFGVVLCGVVKPAHGKPLVFRADQLNKNWKTGRSDDSAVVKAIVDELSSHDIWVAHNGARFDVPFLRTRLLRWGLGALPSAKLIDPVFLARNKLRMSFNSLSQVANLLGCNNKTEVQPEVWLKAALDGDKKSMDYIVAHCVADVDVLEQVVGALKVYSTAYNSWGSGF